MELAVLLAAPVLGLRAVAVRPAEHARSCSAVSIGAYSLLKQHRVLDKPPHPSRTDCQRWRLLA